MVSTSLLALAILVPAKIDAADYFPLAPGTKWVYQETTKGAIGIVTDEVKPPELVGEESAFPIETRQEGVVLDKVYYRMTPDAVLIVAYDAKKPLESPRPAFRIGNEKLNWTYVGTVSVMGDSVPVTVKGVSTPKGKRKVLDRDVECIEVLLEARMGGSGPGGMETKQTAIYGKGIGLVEMTSRNKAGRRTEESKLKLLEFTPGKP